MAVHYSLPERRKHHEEMVRRLISNPEARNKMNTYIYRQEYEEKDRICKILDQWDNAEYSTEPSSQVINKQAVPHIKEWCSNSSGKDLVTVKKFLQHLTNEQNKENEKELGGDSTRRSLGSRQNSLLLSDRSGRPKLTKRDTITNGSFYPDPGTGRGNSTGMFNIVKSVPQPNLVNKPAGKRPTTGSSQASSSRKPSGLKRGATQPAMSRRNDYFEIPTNRSGVFGEVIRAPPQQPNKENLPPARPNDNKRPPSTASGKRGQWSRPGTSQRPATMQSRAGTAQQRPGTMQNRPGTMKSRPGTMQSRPGTMQSQRSYSSRIPVRDGLGKRSKTQGHFYPSHQDDTEKLKFSANLQNVRDEESNQHQQERNLTPVLHQDDGMTPRYPHHQHQHQQHQSEYRIDTSPPATAAADEFDDGEMSHRPIQYPNKFPGRRYQASQITFH
ncbi:uncharacterized protein [Clytia hemisphaerica]|uniref:Uncharacterized protein n=1 Tax=Clytia hemisphaerica TaxID=252671 RepID=A0A7M5X037_9CNID